MPGIMDIISQSLGSEELRQIGRQIGADEKTTANALAMLLDTDNDGDVDISDLAKHGMGLLGKFFR